MTVTATNRAYTGSKYVDTSFDLANFRTVEYDGTNAADVMTWVSGNSINNAPPYLWNDSGVLKMRVRASAMDSPLNWGGTAAIIEAEIPADSVLIFQYNSFIGLVDVSQIGLFPELA